jgi:hypothetical protein
VLNWIKAALSVTMRLVNGKPIETMLRGKLICTTGTDTIETALRY